MISEVDYHRLRRHEKPKRIVLKRLDPTEEMEQMAVVAWARLNAGKYPALKWLYHSPNGGSRHVVEAKKLKAMGVLPGVSDLFLPYPHGGYHGLYLEMKSKKGRATAAQLAFLKWTQDVGYYVTVCYDVHQAIEALLWYLELED